MNDRNNNLKKLVQILTNTNQPILNNTAKRNPNEKQDILKNEIDKLYKCIDNSKDEVDFSINALLYLMKTFDYDQEFIDVLNERENLVIEMIACCQKKKGICSHHSILYKEILNRHNIYCDIIMVIVKNKGRHMLNKIIIDDVSFYVDTSKAIRLYQKNNHKNDNQTYIDIMKKCYFLSQKDLENFGYLIYGKMNDLFYQSIFHDNNTNLNKIPIKSYILGYDYILPYNFQEKKYIKQ